MNWLIALVVTPVALWMLFSAGGRLLLVMAAGLFVFTPGSAAFAPKLVFLAVLFGSSAISLLRLRGTGIKPSGGIVASAACYVVTLFIAALEGWSADPQATLQNGLPYVMVLLIPPIAIDAGMNSNRRLLESGMLVVGITGTLSFTVHWLARRGVSSLDINGLFATSLLLPALVFQWGLMVTTDKSRTLMIRFLAAGLSLLIPFALLVTGTRSALVLGVGFAVFLVWRLRHKRILLTAGSAIAAVAIAVPLLGWLASKLLKETDFLTRRLEALQYAVVYGSRGDESLAGRNYSSDVVRSAVEGQWLFGLGLSTPDPIAAFDTPLSTVMRIGVAGNFFLLLYLIAVLWWAMKAASQNSAGDAIRAMIVGWFLTVFTYGALLGPPTDDRLFAFAFANAVALALNTRYGHSRDAHPPIISNRGQDAEQSEASQPQSVLREDQLGKNSKSKTDLRSNAKSVPSVAQ